VEPVGLKVPESSKKNKRRKMIMAKYFYVYNIAGVEDSIVKMFNTDTDAMGEKSVKKDRMDGFIDGIKTSGFVLNKELAEADVAEAEAKRVLAEKMTAYQAARDDYHNKSETLKKVKAKYGIK
jgi:hypothetical protein